MKIKATNNYCDISEMKISSLPYDKTIDIDFDDKNINFPVSAAITRVDKNLVLVTPFTWLSDLDFLRDDMFHEESIMKYMITTVEHVKNTIKAVKKFSSSEPYIAIDTEYSQFIYTLTLNGKKISDIYLQLKRMYEEIDAENGKYPEICKALIEEKI